jgi:adenylate cyclase
LIEKNGLEKIKTIGDCYMVASGVPRARPDHSTALVDRALDMPTAVNERECGGPRLSFRMGTKCGPVVAGVIGRKKFIYDLWVENVNLASEWNRTGEHDASRSRQHLRIGKACVRLYIVRTDRDKGAGTTEVWHVVGKNRTSKSPDLNVLNKTTSKESDIFRSLAFIAVVHKLFFERD